MSYERIVNVKRSIYISECSGCGGREQTTENPPRERFCSTCQKWVPYKEVSYTGPELTKS